MTFTITIETNPCLDGIVDSPVVIPNMTVIVSESTSHQFSYMTSCGLATSTTSLTYAWLTITEDAATSMATLTVAPTDNSQVMTTTTIAHIMTLVDYPNAPPISTNFDVAIEENVCMSGNIAAVSIPTLNA